MKTNCAKKVLLALLAIVAAQAGAEERVDYTFHDEAVGDVTYSLYYEVNADGESVTITRSEFPTGHYNLENNEWVWRPQIDLVIPSQVTLSNGTYSVTAIADAASQSSGVFYSGRDVITSVTVPNTMTRIGFAAFWNCAKIERVILGNSVSEIGDYAFQYCTGLTAIALPNSLTTIGTHFLCGCTSLETIVIPAACTSIGECFLHGCNNMRSVYLLGDTPPALDWGPFESASPGETGSEDCVHDCTFYVNTQEAKDDYEGAKYWEWAKENFSGSYYDDYAGGEHENGGQGYYHNNGNKYSIFDNHEIVPFADHWITACYPTDVDAAAVFGDDCRVAEMTKAHYNGIDAHGNYLYHLTFTEVSSKKMAAQTPYLIKCDPKNVGSAFIIQHVDGEADITDLQLAATIDIDNQTEDPTDLHTQVRMLGTFQPDGHTLTDGEFLFYNPKDDNGDYDKKMGFVRKDAHTAGRHVGTYRCYWELIKDDVVQTDARIGFFGDDDGPVVNGIRTEIEIVAAPRFDVYTLGGQLLRRGVATLDGLPAGIYVVGGRKVVVK